MKKIKIKYFYVPILFSRYDFVVKNSGTHFYHSHISTHMLDGQIGSFIVKDPPRKNPHRDLYDKDEIVIFLSDWIHELSFERYPGYYRYNVLGQTAENILINGLGNYTVSFTLLYHRKFIELLNFFKCYL